MNLAAQVARYRSLDAEGVDALVEAAMLLLGTADDDVAWSLFALALNRARPIAEMATHPVWSQMCHRGHRDWPLPGERGGAVGREGSGDADHA